MKWEYEKNRECVQKGHFHVDIPTYELGVYVLLALRDNCHSDFHRL